MKPEPKSSNDDGSGGGAEGETPPPSNNTATITTECPYAVALLKATAATAEDGAHSIVSEDASSSASVSSSSHHPSSTTAVLTEEWLETTRQNCPAFVQAQGCPFKDASNPTQVKETLLQIPPSHYEMSTFRHVLQGLHNTSITTANKATNNSNDADDNKQQQQQKQQQLPRLEPQYQLPGGCCPVPQSIKERVTNQNGGEGFRQALENMSLAAIMARLAEEFEAEQEQQEQNEEGRRRLVHHPEDKDPENDTKEKNDSVTAENTTTTTSRSPSASSVNEATNRANNTNTTPSSASSSSSTVRLSQSLKTGTAVAHEAAEQVHFVKNFIRGQIDRHLYGQLVLALYYIYHTLEHALKEHAPQYFPTCHFPLQLQRLESLQADVEFWHGPAGLQQVQSILANNKYKNNHNNNYSNHEFRPSPATVDYMERIRDIAVHDPLLLLAHSYTRYLGDLSGGKILARVARRALHLGPRPPRPKPKPSRSDNENDHPTTTTTTTDDGLAFYEFAAIPSAKVFKDEYRQALDALSLSSDDQIPRLVREANIAFVLNMRIFQELDVAAGIPDATVRPLEQVWNMKYSSGLSDDDGNDRSGHGSGGGKNGTAAATAEAKCPFIMTDQKPTTKSTTTTVVAPKPSSSRCPWPFVLFHDPRQFLCDWQTWALVGLLLCCLYSYSLSSSSSSSLLFS